ncbi:unnamed protein product [Phyllotreta striolata]|uniref:Ig-like domain-containing protein n=1 Tax=Phyllotreta striolata TaxID=444603 RepID=A0A9N9TTF7_PHYSR|nr:unnamed protein product [Phyllotreta striolata]
MERCNAILLLLYFASYSGALRLTSMSAPNIADVRDKMELDCHFDMGNEELYAVKWYKDDQEFFRYMPKGQQQMMSFPVPGVKLETHGGDCNQRRCKINLTDLTRMHSGGAYRCEISSEAPAFRLASETHNVTVAALAKDPPKIDGLAETYMEGDTFNVKCTSNYADPEPILTWKINGLDPPPDAISHISSSEPDHMGLIAQTLTLRFTMNERSLQGREIEVRCESIQPGLPESKRTSSKKVPIRTPGDQQEVKKQKWYASGFASKFGPSIQIHIAWLLLWVLVMKWI